MSPSQLKHCKSELAKLEARIRMQGKSLQTERSYSRSVRRYIEFICSKKWEEDTSSEFKAEAFLTAEAKRDVAASTQNGAFHAICYYYREVRKTPLVDVDALRAKVGEHVRQAPSREDVRKLLMAIQDSGPHPTRLIVHLLYACGLRIGETLMIRLKDIDLESAKLTIIAGKNKKDRFINLPPSLIAPLKIQMQAAEACWKKAVSMGVPVKLPHLMDKKNPSAAFQKRWFFLFPMAQPCIDPRGAGRVWWRCLDDTVQRAMRTANKRAGLEGITPHHLRHAWATHAHREGACLRDVQDILGHRDPKTTARYIRPDPERVKSPIESLDIAI
jgi:site-specific recombinase XerD